MKNLHLLPTDKPTGIFESKISGLQYSIMHKIRTNPLVGLHIYITNDEEIKGDWFLRKGKIHKLRYNDGNGNLWTKNGLKIYASGSKKIILTTDSHLIAEGVQAIDNDFLQWFVKNPSCERVEVNEYFKPSNMVYGHNAERA
jgi:hypothetical protein